MIAARLILHPPGGPAWNMAVDESLLQSVIDPVLRLYEWRTPAISIGYFQSHRIVPPNRTFVRRYTGGGLVDHTSDFTYTVVVPRDSRAGALTTAESYSLIHQAVAAALKALAVPAALTQECETAESLACFQKPVRFDVMLDSLKIAGAAQRRTRRGMLHQGSILLPDPSLYPRLRAVLPGFLGEALNLTWSASDLNQEEAQFALSLESIRYSQDGWNRER